ncbi:MAG: M23 family metallopeptidase [Spirochaetales bacterium]|nr:M23 family metallopeptidase [Spirochaetales bacterium]
MKKNVLAAILALSAVSLANAFDWPLAETTPDTVASGFGQLRGGTLSSSVIYKEDAVVRSSDDGIVIAVIDDQSEAFGWFESSLGTAAIISHSDGLSTVYGNLNSNSLHETLGETERIKAYGKIATSGNSGWQESSNGLEFKVFDKKNLASVNPKILMPRVVKEPHLEAGSVYLMDKNGNFRNINTEKRIAAGTYFVYKTRQSKVVPYKTIVAVNGETAETIVYDTIKENNGKLGLTGNGHYSTQDIYPDEEKQLLAKVQLTKGQSTLTITLVNIQENSTLIHYKLDIY